MKAPRGQGSASYLVLAVILASIRGLQPRARRAGPQLTSARGTGLAAVVRLAIGNPVLRATTIMFALFNIGEGALLVLLPHRAVGLGLGTGGYGYLVATVTGGELAAAAVLARRPWRAPLLLSIIIAQLIAALAVLTLLTISLAATLLGLVVLGACTAPMTAWAQTLRMRLVPGQAHGRLFALLRTVMQATPPLGAGLAAVTMRLGGAATVWAVVAAMGLPALLFAPWLLTAQPGKTPAAARPLTTANSPPAGRNLVRRVPPGNPGDPPPRKPRPAPLGLSSGTPDPPSPGGDQHKVVLSTSCTVTGESCWAAL